MPPPASSARRLEAFRRGRAGARRQRRPGCHAAHRPPAQDADGDETRRTASPRQNSAEDETRRTCPAAARPARRPRRSRLGDLRHNRARRAGRCCCWRACFTAAGPASRATCSTSTARQLEREIEAEQLTDPDQIWNRWTELSRGNPSSFLLHGPRKAGEAEACRGGGPRDRYLPQQRIAAGLREGVGTRAHHAGARAGGGSRR